jgi:IMP dehydrogenase
VGAAVGVGQDASPGPRRFCAPGWTSSCSTAPRAFRQHPQGCRALRDAFPDAQIIGGNVATYNGAKALIEAGVDTVKVGIVREASAHAHRGRVGVPQITAILEAGAPAARRTSASSPTAASSFPATW